MPPNIKRPNRRPHGETRPQAVKDILREARLRLAKLPDYDTRPADKILGYDKDGLPH